MERYNLELHTVQQAELHVFDTVLEAESYMKEFGLLGVIYTWHCEERHNWLDRGIDHYNSIAWVVLPYELATQEQYVLPDDEPGEVEVELHEKCRHTLAPKVCIACVNDELVALDIPVTIIPKFIDKE